MEKIREKFIPYGKQYIDDKDIEAVEKTLRSDFLTTGPKIEEFETRIANYVGSKYAVAVSSGTAALHAACIAAGLKDGDEVITTPMTFAATANCILYVGAKPVFVDINPKTYNINLDGIRRKINRKTKAILPVHYTGQPCNMDEIKEIAKEHNLIIIEDAAHAFGATYKEQVIGSIGDMTCFSFHPVKHITTGEGGAITTNSLKLYNKLMMIRNHGITRSKENLLNDDGPWYYEQQILGYNYRITDFQASLGISQIDKSDLFLKKRREYAQMYNDSFKNIDGIIVPFQDSNTNSSWHLYVIQLEIEKLRVSRKEIFEELRRRKIGVNVHYIPVYYHPFYKEMGYEKGKCPNSERFYERIITLPLHPLMSLDELEYIVDNVIELVNTNRR